MGPEPGASGIPRGVECQDCLVAIADISRRPCRLPGLGGSRPAPRWLRGHGCLAIETGPVLATLRRQRTRTRVDLTARSGCRKAEPRGTHQCGRSWPFGPRVSRGGAARLRSGQKSEVEAKGISDAIRPRPAHPGPRAVRPKAATGTWALLIQASQTPSSVSWIFVDRQMDRSVPVRAPRQAICSRETIDEHAGCTDVPVVIGVLCTLMWPSIHPGISKRRPLV